MTTILLLGDHRYALAFVRSLAGAGYRVLVGGSGSMGYAANSRFASGTWRYPAITGSGEEFVTALAQFLSAHPEVDLVVPLGDTEVATMAENRHRLPTDVQLAAPSVDVVRACASKAVMCRIAEELHVPQAAYGIARNGEEVLSCGNAVGFPCVARAGDGPRSIFGQKAIICHSAHELGQAFSSWPEGVGLVLVQRFASGQRHNVQLLAAKGELICRVQTKTLRTDRPDHTGYTTESITVKPDPAIDEYCRTLLRKLDYDGYGCAQFLIDEETGAVSFLEINVRLGAAFAISACCGTDFPRLGAELALSGEINTLRPNYKVGKRIVWFYGDLQGVIRAREIGQITRRQAFAWIARAIWSFIRADMHTTWHWLDPRPTLICYTNLGLKGLRQFVPKNWIRSQAHLDSQSQRVVSPAHSSNVTMSSAGAETPPSGGSQIDC